MAREEEGMNRGTERRKDEQGRGKGDEGKKDERRDRGREREEEWEKGKAGEP